MNGTVTVELIIDGMQISTKAWITMDKQHQNAVYVGRNEMFLRDIGYVADGIANVKSDGSMMVKF